MSDTTLDFEKGEGLLPVIIQEARTGRVLMLGYMNREALEKTRAERQVTFYSRSKRRLWTKGETSGNRLVVEEIMTDCDQDCLLIMVTRTGPVCHTGEVSCFSGSRGDVLGELEEVIDNRRTDPNQSSYTSKLIQSGLSRVAQKVGEEAVEAVIAALAADKTKLVEETADLFFHLLVLLRAKDVRFSDVLEELRRRRQGKQR